jgi:hypothetical protein
LKSGLPRNMEPLRKHVDTLARASEKSDLQITGALWDLLGLDLRDLGDYEGAKEKHQQALDIKMKVYGPDHPEVAGTLNNRWKA